MSGKRWTPDDDIRFHAYSGVGGKEGTRPFSQWLRHIAKRDFSRPEDAGPDRYRKLKASGAWDALNRMAAAQEDFLRAAHSSEFDDADPHP